MWENLIKSGTILLKRGKIHLKVGITCLNVGNRIRLGKLQTKCGKVVARQPTSEAEEEKVRKRCRRRRLISSPAPSHGPTFNFSL